jgi:hypothetical protein
VRKEADVTPEDVRSELEKHQFIPFRLHLVSGAKVEVRSAAAAFMLHNAVLVLQNQEPGDGAETGYDVIALRNIERLEQLQAAASSAAGGPEGSR